ncbi:MAG TPA: ABC transporter ATP-binding protein [Solirubrobacteraceae bacterium]|jgi:iron(III) transport system ATP-binding protein|nr:ABC transporter ATP-binding protein [Solirubrobacteraceae bacterium]
MSRIAAATEPRSAASADANRSASALSVRTLCKSFGRSPVLAGLELDVQAGSLTAVLGSSGCGKTTLLRLIAGFEHADEGTIEVGGRLVSGARTHVAPERRGVGFVAQEGALFPHLDVAANVAFGLARAERKSPRVGELLELVGLAGLERRHPHELSGGQQQRVALARALAPSPRVVLLDEPFDALDASLRVQVRAEVREALRHSGATALLVTHDQQEALSLADVVAVMREGQIVQAADPQTLYSDPLDAELAGFLGEAVLLRGVLHDGFAETALGRLTTRGARIDSKATTVAATVMLRPEQIACCAPSSELPRGRVLSTQFYGHDATAEIALEDPTAPRIFARTAGHVLPRAGEEVSLLVAGTALVLQD